MTTLHPLCRKSAGLMTDVGSSRVTLMSVEGATGNPKIEYVEPALDDAISVREGQPRLGRF
jgi:hypothetical protein